MDIRHEMVRRQLSDLDRAQNEAMPKFREGLKRLWDPKSGVSADQKAAAFTDSFTRRKFIRLGGVTVATGTILAACGSDDADPGVTGTETTGGATTGGTGGDAGTDGVVAKTAASVELYAVAVYNTAIDAAEALGITPTVAAAATLFRDHHQAHADAFNGLIPGNEATEPNATAAGAFKDTVDALASEADVLAFAFDLENIAAETYVAAASSQGTVPMLSTGALRSTVMSIAGVEARHAAAIATLAAELGKPQWPASGFYAATSTVNEDFFVS